MQKKVESFLTERHLSCDPRARYIDLVAEAGELGKELLLATDYGDKAFSCTDSVWDEMGDCLFSLMALCTAMGIDAQDALNRAIRKYEGRFERYGEIGSTCPAKEER